MRERKGRKAVQGERSSRRLSCDHRGVPSPEKEPPMIRESEKERRRERERKVLAGEREREKARDRKREKRYADEAVTKDRERERETDEMRSGGEGGRARREGPWARGPCRDHSVPTRRAGRFRIVPRAPLRCATTRRCAAVRQRERGRLPRGIGERTCPWEDEKTPPGACPQPPVSSSSFSSRDASRGPRRQDAAGRDSGSAPVKGAARVPSSFFFSPRGPDLAGAASSSTPPSLSPGCRSLREVAPRGIDRKSVV